MATATRPEFAPLTSDARVDVCVVGAGIAGLTTAYHLVRAGKSVLVLEDGEISSGETERTTAHLVSALDDRYFELERLHGEKGARLAAESHSAAIDRIERIASDERIDCDFERVDGYLFNVPGQPDDLLDRELAATLRAGLITEIVARAPLASFDTGRALRFPRQAQFHPLKYLAGLAGAIVRHGGRICTQTHATRMKGGSHANVQTHSGAVVECDAIVVATNTPVNDRLAVHTKQAPYRSYVIGAVVPAGAIPKVLYWDTEEPYHYVRLQAGDPAEGSSDILIVGGEDHKTGQADDGDARYARLEAWTRERFPMIGEIRYRWSGQVMEPMDGLAFIGRNPIDHDNVYIATGDSGNGMTHGTIAGMLLSDLIQGWENPWTTLYNPSRVRLKAAKDFTTENVNMAAQYLDWLTTGDVDKDKMVARGCGAIVRHGLTKAAVFRDEDGTFHECSAVCPHLGAIVTWNPGEKTWDCPAHGSRFDRFGQVLNGPANENLKPLDAPAHAEQ